MSEQDNMRKELSKYLNSLKALAKSWGIDPAYLHRWYNGLDVGNTTKHKIENGLKQLKR